MTFFPDPADMSVWGQLFMMLVYGYILLNAAHVLSSGCDLVVLLYGPSLVGSLLIPVLGALPDCLIILFSGIGSGTKDEIQDSLQIGVGTLVGSTVMLLTLPWAGAVWLGRRDLDAATGEAAYTTNAAGIKKAKLTVTTLQSCVTTTNDVPASAKILALLSLVYWVIQIPAFFFHSDTDKGEFREKPWALTAMIASVVALGVYCAYQVFSASAEEEMRRQQEVQKRKVWAASMQHKFSQSLYEETIFRKYDADNSGTMDAKELNAALNELGLKVERRDVAALLASMDIGDPDATGAEAAGKGDGQLSLAEFKHAIKMWMHHPDLTAHHEKSIAMPESASLSSPQLRPTAGNKSAPLASMALDSSVNGGSAVAPSPRVSRHESQIAVDEAQNAAKEVEEDDEDEEEEEDEMWHLTDGQLKLKAFLLLAGSVGVVSFFSDPMVDVIGAFGKSIKIDAFYISFVVTPIASNASEVIAGLIFAAKKTNEGVSLCHSSLLGGASMNATMCLAVFMALIYFRGLTWSFSAEVITLFLVTIIVAFNNAVSQTIKLWQALMVALLYPFAIVFIWALKTKGGLD